jgi:NAD+ synthase (glutamine-hydrolysing)
MKNLKIALGQMRVYPGQITKNFSTIEHMVLQAKKQEVDLIIFPELCLTGYLIGDQFLDNEWIDYAVSFNEKIKQLSSDIIIIWGNVFTLASELNITNNDSRLAKLNAGFVAYNKEYVSRKNGLLTGVYPKRLFPNYRIFDDQRYFLPGRELEEKLGYKVKSLLSPFILNYKSEEIVLGLEVCEDMWDEAYGFSPSKEFLKQGATLIVNISASPWTIDKEISREHQILAHSKVPFIFVNKVGADNNGKNLVMFDGGSMIFNALGEKEAQANCLGKEELFVVPLGSKRLSNPSENKLYDMLTLGLAYFDEQLFNKKINWIIGLSGGIDSAVSLALLQSVIDPKRIYAYSLPTIYNSELTKNNARYIAQQLNISFEEISIQPLYEAFLEYQPHADSLTKENIQARVRGSLLMNLASEKNAIVLNNGNKIEIALGYATLYGDTIGAIAPLGDLTKLQIINLAEYINRINKKTIIPENLIASFIDDVPIFDLVPSAELKEKQVDPMKWGYHDWLINELLSFPSLAPERILTMFLEDSFPPHVKRLIHHYNLHTGVDFVKDLEWILKNWNRSYFKRIQMPPNILVSKGAFGYDYRESQTTYEFTAKYHQLSEKIYGITLSPKTN